MAIDPNLQNVVAATTNMGQSPWAKLAQPAPAPTPIPSAQEVMLIQLRDAVMRGQPLTPEQEALIKQLLK